MELQEPLLLEIEQEIYAEPATPGQRFANYLIDLFVFYACAFIVGMVKAIVSAPSLDDYGEGIGRSRNFFMEYFISICMYLALYTLLEGLTKGRTLGKLITGTKVVKDDSAPITWWDAFLRSLSRLVPFEPFSAFGGYPWHDRWTGTRVVKFKK